MTQNEIKWFLRGIILGILSVMAGLIIGQVCKSLITPAPEAICLEPTKVPREMTPIVSDMPEPEPTPEPTPEPSIDEQIAIAVSDAANAYSNVREALIYGVIYNESRFKPDVSNGTCVGLMQVSTYWHANRAKKLGVSDLYDISGNILTGTDYLSELIDIYKSEYLALMVYHGEANAVSNYNNGIRSWYADSVISYANSL